MRTVRDMNLKDMKDWDVKDWDMKDWDVKDWDMKDWDMKDWDMKDWMVHVWYRAGAGGHCGATGGIWLGIGLRRAGWPKLGSAELACQVLGCLDHYIAC